MMWLWQPKLPSANTCLIETSPVQANIYACHGRSWPLPKSDEFSRIKVQDVVKNSRVFGHIQQPLSQEHAAKSKGPQTVLSAVHDPNLKEIVHNQSAYDRKRIPMANSGLLALPP